MIGIYTIECVITGKCYVGSSINIRRRLNRHRAALSQGKHGSVLLQRAWDKYGAGTFDMCIVELCTRDDLLSREQWWIDHTDSDYNVAREAGRVTGWRATNEQKLASSARARKMWSDDPERRRLASKQAAAAWTPEMRFHASARGRERFSTMESRVILGEKIRASLSSDDVRRKRSEDRRRDWQDPEKRARILEGRRLARATRAARSQDGEPA